MLDLLRQLQASAPIDFELFAVNLIRNSPVSLNTSCLSI